MANRIITALIQGEYIKLSSATAGAAGSHNAVSLELSFDSLWDGTSRKVYFISADGAQTACVTLTTDLLKTGETGVYVVPVPSEGLASAGDMTLTVKGWHVTGAETDRVVMSASVRMTVLRSDKPAADTEPADVTPTQAEQLQGEIDAIKLTVTDARAAATEAKGSADAAKQSETAASASAAPALAAQTAAETARNAAQAAETAAENAQAAAIAAKTTAETKAAEAAASEANALAYKNAAIAAQQAAETAEADANSAKTAAQNSETAAGTSAASAAAKATEAADNAANALNSKNAAAAAQKAAEDARDAALSYKAAALASQQAAANAQAAAEAARSAAVTAQTAAEAARDAAQTAKTAAETAQSKAETAQSGAESAKTAAQTAQSLAEAAKTAAQGAATAAQAAQSAAETARTGAQTAETNAGASADEAEAWACGTIGGVAVPSTHPAYNNNSKYYKDQAAAIIGGDFATTADVAAAKNEAISTAAADAKTKADAVQTNLNSHTGNTANPHSVTKTQVGLGNADNTADADKPVSTAQQAAINNAVSTHNSAADAHSTLFAGKVNKKVPAAAGNLAALDSTGNLADSGKKSGDFAASSHNHSASNITSGTLPISRGGTGATSAAEARTGLGAQAALTAGANITISGNTISATGGALPRIVATAPTGSTVTCTKDATTLTATEAAGTWTFDLPDYGTWTVTATLSGDTTSATITVDTVKIYSVTLTYLHIYGVLWDGTSTTAFSRTDDAAGFTNPVPYISGATNYSSPFDNIHPWAGMVRTTDATAGELVAIPKYWFKWTKSGDTLKLQIADKATAGFYVSPAHADRGDGAGERDIVYVGRYHCNSAYKSVTGAAPQANITRASARTSIHNLGSNIWQYDFAMYWTIMMLYLVEFADWNSQDKIGYGCGNNSAAQAVGASDSMPYHTGTMQSSRTTYGVGCQYRYIEGLWDNVYAWCDGIYFSGSNVYCIKNPASFSDTANGTNIGTRPTSSNYISAWSIPTASGFEYALYPSAVAGSESTYICDYCNYSSSGVVLGCGGYFGQGQNRGLFYLNGNNTASGLDASIGCRLQKLP